MKRSVTLTLAFLLVIGSVFASKHHSKEKSHVSHKKSGKESKSSSKSHKKEKTKKPPVELPKTIIRVPDYLRGVDSYAQSNTSKPALPSPKPTPIPAPVKEKAHEEYPAITEESIALRPKSVEKPALKPVVKEEASTIEDQIIMGLKQKSVIKPVPIPVSKPTVKEEDKPTEEQLIAEINAYKKRSKKEEAKLKELVLSSNKKDVRIYQTSESDINTKAPIFNTASIEPKSLSLFKSENKPYNPEVINSAEVEPLKTKTAVKEEEVPNKIKAPVMANEKPLIDFLTSYTRKYVKNPFDHTFDSYLFISIKKQRMYHVVNDQIVKTWVISGAKNGAGNKYGSNKTPIGLHTIVEKFGYNAPKGGLFVQRNFTGKVAKIHNEKYCVGSDDVTSRVMWLRGEEKGINKGGKIDSYQRYIYIHGTPEEGLIGVPSSEGCIRMKNSEVIDLFNFAFVGMKVLILEEL